MKDSPALAFIRHLYQNALTASGHSWQRLNSCLYQSVRIAIEAGLPFGSDDFALMRDHMKGSFWFHDGGPETWYAEAIQHGNRSAWKALEAFFHRKPFLLGGDRLHVGYKLAWQGHNATVTSFDLDGRYLNACVTVYDPKECRSKVSKRFKITHDDLRAAGKKGGAA